MAHTYEELKKKKVAELRQIASGIEHDAVKGYTQMHKEHLLKALCSALGIDIHEHHIAKIKDKTKIKETIKELQKKRNEAIVAHDHATLAVVRRKIHHFKRALHRAAV